MDAPRIPRIEAWLVPAAALLLAALFCRPLAVDPDNWGISDWDQHLFFHAVPRRTILHYGETPLWNPYNPGGLPDLGNPQSRILSPTFPLVLAFGVIHGVKIDIALHCAAAFVFTWLLARKLGSSRAASALAAGVYAFGGLAVYPVAFGMTWSLTIAYVPLLFLGFWKAVEDLRWAWLGGLALALILFGGGAYVLVIAGFFLGSWRRSRRSRRGARARSRRWRSSHCWGWASRR